MHKIIPGVNTESRIYRLITETAIAGRVLMLLKVKTNIKKLLHHLTERIIHKKSN